MVVFLLLSPVHLKVGFAVGFLSPSSPKTSIGRTCCLFVLGTFLIAGVFKCFLKFFIQHIFHIGRWHAKWLCHFCTHRAYTWASDATICCSLFVSCCHFCSWPCTENQHLPLSHHHHLFPTQYCCKKQGMNVVQLMHSSSGALPVRPDAAV